MENKSQTARETASPPPANNQTSAPVPSQDSSGPPSENTPAPDTTPGLPSTTTAPVTTAPALSANPGSAPGKQDNKKPPGSGRAPRRRPQRSTASVSVSVQAAQAPPGPQPLPTPTSATTLPPPPPPQATIQQYQYGPPLPVPYPHPPRMNPGYPVNGSPYGHPAATPSPYHSTPSPHNGVPHAPPPYGYYPSQHYPAQQYHPYPTAYPHYAVPGYSAPPPPPPQAQPQQSPDPEGSVSNGSQSKRKRKGTLESGKGKSSGASDAEESTDMHKKRTKTQRACDSCRSRKIRCDVLSDSDPPVCQHCKQYGFECTFFLPITETRFKKKRLEEEAAAAAASSAAAAEKEKTTDAESSQRSPLPDSTRHARVDGPTSMTHLLHSTATIPPRAYHSYDQRYHHTWEVGKTGDGLIQVLEPTGDTPSLSKPIDLHVERDVIEKLINSYFTDVAPLVPIITQAEFLTLSDPSPPPILLYSICLVAASKRDVPQAVFDHLRVAVNDVIKSEDVLSTANIVNVQSLLILCQCADCHSQFVPNALSALWIRLGTAIRMAQDLGLHRAEAVKANIEMRRRIWGACVITDRWTSLTYGHPYMIDVEDCDARLPSSGDPNDSYTAELLRLSLILGRVLKTVYGPSGLTHATDEKLYALLNDMKDWQDKLPEDLKFKGPDTPRSGGLLFLLYATVSMIFWRVFMRISYSCPQHVKLCLTIEKWSELKQMTGDAIDWLDAHETVYDVWMLVAYAATSCALVQYHTWARRKDANAQARLRKLRDCVRRWEACLQPEQMSSRRKTAEIITLLYETTLGPPSHDHQAGLNPTAGVVPKHQGRMKGVKYRNDPTRPGKGVFIAHGKAKEGDYTDLPEGTVVISQGFSDEESEGEVSAAEVSVVRPTNDPASSSPTHAYSTSTSGTHLAPRTRVPASPESSDITRHELTARAAAASGTGPGAGVGNDTSSASSMPSYIPTTSGSGGDIANVNPALNAAGPSDVLIMNTLETNPQPSVLDEMSIADTGFLEGIPGGMFDWPQWETFFSRFSAPGDTNALAALAHAQAQAQQRQQQQQQPSQQRRMEHNLAANASQQQHYQS
ncbi:uncharacterized protein FOMMEDRAFT_104282 [Fomitiporia mediterranea MF3/22]|uniref:uncharacterized protein n=1 Tax=Fomitiporia mediterranea (strain MF3/22) TaxID=694068 RepID=UPI000440824A|nr:uncharacterized protein FOMMEDRAFT_104282 [Fomitiporia mediterranea MF3/22]EJD05925.1 hypothetical protein FOMMEDRAFT_104282 [Fomitiporia mediterranea MF3/22]